MLCISSIECLRFKAKKNEFVMFMKSFELVVYLYDLCGYCLQQLNVEFFTFYAWTDQETGMHTELYPVHVHISNQKIHPSS